MKMPFTTLFGLILLLLSACSSAQPPIRVTFVSPGIPNMPFWTESIAFMQASANDLNIELQVLYAESRSSFVGYDELKRQIAQGKKPHFIISIFHRSLYHYLFKLSQENQIGYFTINSTPLGKFIKKSGLPRQKFSHWLGQMAPDDFQAGYSVAKHLIALKQIKNSVAPIDLIALSGAEVSSASQERNAGLTKALLEHQNVQLKQLIYTDWNPKIAYSTTRKLLDRYPNTQIIWAASDAIAIAARRASVGKDIVIAGIDWSQEGVAALARGDVSATVGGHFTEGGFALVLLHDYFHGADFLTELGTKIKTNMSLLDRHNLEEYRQILHDNDFEKIDFRQLSKILNPQLKRYDLSWKNLFTSIQDDANKAKAPPILSEIRDKGSIPN